MNLNQIPRGSHAVFPLQRIGFLFPIRTQARMMFTNKLELCLRLASDAPYAVDEIDGTVYRTPFPHVVLKLPGSVHSYEIDSPREAVYLQYAPELEGAMRSAELLNTPRVWQVVLTPEIYTQIYNLHRMLRNPANPGVIEQIDLAAMSLFEHLIVQDPVRNPLPEEIAELLLETALPVSEIAQKVNLKNIFYFSRQFRRFYGMTPMEYRRRAGMGKQL